MNRDERVKVFEDTFRMCQTDRRLIEGIAESISGQRIVTGSEDVPPSVRRFGDQAEVRVSGRRTLEAASMMNGRTCVLNFADAYLPGGLVKQGSAAQEECLCRCSTLYPCITDERMTKGFYDVHRAAGAGVFTDLIYTPGVIVFKDDDTYDPLKREFHVDVVTCAAPNLCEVRMSDTGLRNVHVEDARRILALACERGCDNVVLGAFGCGVFRNDPVVVAEAFASVLPDFMHSFRRIEFAVYCRDFEDGNFKAFDRVMKRYQV